MTNQIRITNDEAHGGICFAIRDSSLIRIVRLRRFNRTGFVILVFAAAMLLSLPAAALAAAPNILFLISDDHSSFSLGCYGSNVCTPNLDKLAAGGVRFTNAFVASPQCSPSRSAMLTGLSPHQTNACRLHTTVHVQFPML